MVVLSSGLLIFDYFAYCSSLRPLCRQFLCAFSFSSFADFSAFSFLRRRNTPPPPTPLTLPVLAYSSQDLEEGHRQAPVNSILPPPPPQAPFIHSDPWPFFFLLTVVTDFTIAATGVISSLLQRACCGGTNIERGFMAGLNCNIRVDYYPLGTIVLCLH